MSRLTRSMHSARRRRRAASPARGSGEAADPALGERWSERAAPGRRRRLRQIRLGGGGPRLLPRPVPPPPSMGDLRRRRPQVGVALDCRAARALRRQRWWRWRRAHGASPLSCFPVSPSTRALVPLPRSDQFLTRNSCPVLASCSSLGHGSSTCGMESLTWRLRLNDIYVHCEMALHVTPGKL